MYNELEKLKKLNKLDKKTKSENKDKERSKNTEDQKARIKEPQELRNLLENIYLEQIQESINYTNLYTETEY